MVPSHSGNLIVATSFALAFWSYIPLYTLPITICGHLLKLPIEVCGHCLPARRSHALRNETPGENPYGGPRARQ